MGVLGGITYNREFHICRSNFAPNLIDIIDPLGMRFEFIGGDTNDLYATSLEIFLPASNLTELSSTDLIDRYSLTPISVKNHTQVK